MCGISGIYSFSGSAEQFRSIVETSIHTLQKRGPEIQSVSVCNNVALGHARLAILDTSSAGNQPFSDITGRYTIVYNGEFYNYKDYYKELQHDGVQFQSSSDTEVLLYLYIKYGQKCVDFINGFFAFAVYDSIENTLFIARDRIGIKPLYYIKTDTYIGFSSEMKGILAFPFERKLNNKALFTYLQLMYVPAPMTMLENIYKLEPGKALYITKTGIKQIQYFSLHSSESCNYTYEKAQQVLVEKITESVQKRLISDVPLGTFLSGGIDSSIISTIASHYIDNLQTFSIGFKDNPFIDETKYAQLVAKKIHSQHTEIQIDTKTLQDSLYAILQDIDEPFADSSAIAVHVLCKYVKPHVTVALSGDGADELLAGYHKHWAQYNQMNHPMLNSVMHLLHPLFNQLPQSRSNIVFNAFRKVAKYANIANMNCADVYWNLCCFATDEQVRNILLQNDLDISDIKQLYVSHFTKNSNINDVLLADQKLVLANDMLTKVDRMSMDNSLEVRVPFLDHNLVEFVNSLPMEFKINNKMKKRILQDAFQKDLPIELYNRPKKGFEVPLQEWSRTLFIDIENELLSEQFICEQNLFNYSAICKIKEYSKLSSYGDYAMQLWALLVFQSWWKRYLA